jgi:uncharacterized delta-60 repeat protein
MSDKHSGRKCYARRTRLARVICETLEQRQLFSGLPSAADNVADLTAITTTGESITLDPALQGPIPFAFTNGQPKAESIQPDGKRLVAGYVNGNWAIARNNVDGSLDSTFGGDGKATIDLGTSSDRALNITIQPDGKILLLGVTAGSGDNWQFAAVRLNVNGSYDTSFADNGKLLTGLGRAPTYGGVAIVLKDGRIHITGWDGNTSKAMEYNADGKEGFDRLANLNTLHTQDLDSRARPTAPARGTLGWFAARSPILAPDAGLSHAPMHAEDIGLVVGDTYEAGIPDGTGRTLDWGDGTTEGVAVGLSSLTHSYSSAGPENTSATGSWGALTGTYSFRPASGIGTQGMIRAMDLNLADGDALDTDNHDLVLSNPTASFSTLQQWVLGGFSDSVDSDKTGIVSTAGQEASGTTILALFDNAQAGFTNWPQGTTSTIPANSIVGNYTYIGDVDMDGAVRPQDYTGVDVNLGTSQDPGVAWFYGDTNFDGNIDPTDYAGIDSNLGLGTTTGTALIGGSDDAPMTLETVQVAEATEPPDPINTDPEPVKGPDSLYAVSMPGDDPNHDSVRLTWHPNGDTASSYRIERSTSSDFSTNLTTIDDVSPTSINIDVPYPSPFHPDAVTSDPFKIAGGLTFTNFVSDDLGIVIGAGEEVTIAEDDPGVHSTLTIPDDAILIRNTTYAFGTWGGATTVQWGDKSFEVTEDTQVQDFVDSEGKPFETRDATQGITDEEMRQRGWVGDDGLANLRYVQAGDSAHVSTTISGFFEHYIDTPTADNTYYYRVVGSDGNEDIGGPSNAASATTPADDVADVDGSFVTQFDDGSYGLSWSDNNSNETGYEVIRATNPNLTQGITHFGVGANITSFRDKTAQAGTPYYYGIRPLKRVHGNSGASVQKAKQAQGAIDILTTEGTTLVRSLLYTGDMAPLTFASGTAVHVFADANTLQNFSPLTCRYKWSFENGDSSYSDLPGFNAANIFVNNGTQPVDRHITLTIEKPMGDGTITTYVDQVIITVRPSSALTTYSVSSSADLTAKLASANSNLRILLANGHTFDVDPGFNLRGKQNVVIEAQDPTSQNLPEVKLNVGSRHGQFGDNAIPPLFLTDDNTRNITLKNLNLTSSATTFDEAASPRVFNVEGGHSKNLAIQGCELGNLDSAVQGSWSGTGLLMQQNTFAGTISGHEQILPGYMLYIGGYLTAPGQVTATNIVALGNHAKGSDGQSDIRLEHGSAYALVYDNHLDMPVNPIIKFGSALRMEGYNMWAAKNFIRADSVLLGTLSGSDSNKADTGANVIFDSNVMYDFEHANGGSGAVVEIGPGLNGAVIRNNIFWGPARVMMQSLDAPPPDDKPDYVSQNIWIVNNTRLNPTDFAFLSFWQHGRSDTQVRLKNLHLANNLTTLTSGHSGSWTSSAVALDSLSSSTASWTREVQGNLPDSPGDKFPNNSRWWDASNVWLAGPSFAIGSRSQIETGTTDYMGWNGLFGNTSPATQDYPTLKVGVDSAWRASGKLSNRGNRIIAGNPIGGQLQTAAWDFYGNLRYLNAASGFIVGAVQMHLADQPIPPASYPA